MPESPPDIAKSPRHLILGTAGHIDHGKTSLVRALTGIDTDRLPEEQRRGMTIELGFAVLAIGDTRFGVVDVPGHEKFVRTMVAGATGIDIALLVIAADDSVMPQTIEHVEILNLLGIRHGVVALTKIDAVVEELVDMATEDVRELLAKTPLADAPICPVSALAGTGLEQLKQTILDVSRKVEPGRPLRPFRMAVDRVFTVAGRGTVVTGSALRGEVASGDELEILPAGDTCRVRDLQSHGATTDALQRGQRAALNLSGIDKETVQRGHELATPGYLTPTRIMDVKLTYLASGERPLKSSRVVRLSMGTIDLATRVVLWEGAELAPGESAYAQLRCGSPVTAAYGQRFILRDDAAARTIGGGVVLRPVAQRKRGASPEQIASLHRLDTGDLDERVLEVLRAAGFNTPTHLTICARSGAELHEIPEVLARLRAAGRWMTLGAAGGCVVPSVIDDLGRRLVPWLQRHHQSHPDLPGRTADAVLGWLYRWCAKDHARTLFDKFLSQAMIKQLGQFVCLPAFAPALSAADEKLMQAMIAEIKEGGFQPPLLDALTIVAKADKKRWERLATLAAALGELVLIEPKMYLHTVVEKRLREEVAGQIRASGPRTVAEIREGLHSSRKYVVPFVEYLDRVGFTRRVGDRRELVE